MKRNILKLFVLILLIVPISISALVSSPENFYVTDTSKKLSVDSVNYINKYSTFLYNARRIEYYVVVLKSLENYDLESYTDYIYDSFDISDKGILIVASTNDRSLRIKVGEDLALYIPDDIINEYIKDYFMPYLKNEDWNTGIINGYKAFYKMLCNIYNIDSSEMIVYDGLDFFNKYRNYILIFVIWLNTIISYLFCDYFRRIFINKKYNNTIIDDIIFGVCLFINILMYLLAYLVYPLSVGLVFIAELFAIYSNLTNDKNYNTKSNNKKNVRSKRNKKVRVKR